MNLKLPDQSHCYLQIVGSIGASLHPEHRRSRVRLWRFRRQVGMRPRLFRWRRHQMRWLWQSRHDALGRIQKGKTDLLNGIKSSLHI